MENAGAGCVREILQRKMQRPTVILCGGGNNGGDGFVIARHLANSGVEVAVLLLTDSAGLSGDAKVNFEVLKKMDTSITQCDSDWSVDAFKSAMSKRSDCLVIDAMLGTGATGELRAPFANAVVAANELSAIRVAIDIPTGLDGDTGQSNLAFKANVTCTFVAMKNGFGSLEAKAWLGEVVVIDIGAPHQIFERVQ